MAMPPRSARKPAPYDEQRLEETALRYAGRFATTRARLALYLRRKVKERGWAGEEDPPVERLVERMASLGYVDDRAFASARARGLSSRGYGERRIESALRAAGVGEEDRAVAMDTVDAAAFAAALRFAERKRIGPFAREAPDRRGREKAIQALVRAGHRLDLARRLAHCPPGQVPDPDDS